MRILAFVLAIVTSLVSILVVWSAFVLFGAIVTIVGFIMALLATNAT